MQSTTTLPQTTWKRYGSIILSGIVFLLLDAAILIFSIYISSELKEDALRVSIAGRQASLMEKMTKLLLQINERLTQQQTIELPLSELKKSYDVFDKVLLGFEKGGIVPDGSGQPVELSPCRTAPEKMLIAETQQYWQTLSPLLQQILTQKENTPKTTIEQSLTYALEHGNLLAEKMNRLAFEIEKNEEKELRTLQTIETVIIVMALINFLFLMAYAIRRLADKDKILAEQKIAIASSEEKYRSIFESFPDIYARIDLKGNFLVLSPSAFYHTGFSLPELTGQPFRYLLYEPDEYEKIIELFREKLALSDYEVKIKHKKQGYKEMTLTVRTFFQNGSPHLYELILHDVSQQKEDAKKLKALNEELSKANYSLKRALDLKKEFLAHASHDLKNPLSAIGGVVKLMELEGSLSPSQLENLAMIKSTIQYAVELLEQLVTDAMLDDENIKLTYTEFDVGLLVEEVVTMNRPNAERKKQTLHVDAPKGTLIKADRHKLREAMDNFISNAIKYSPFEKPISIHLKKLEKRIRFEVIDSGPGLTEEDKRKVFGKFQRLSASPTADESSSGLGLSIVKRIIELHRGEVGVISEEGKGATFYFEIPK